MKKVQGNTTVTLLECVNPVKDKWRVRWDVEKHEDGSADYMEEEFGGKPSTDTIKAVVTRWINSQTEDAIRSGFVWNGLQVWLSQENQFNYKMAYDMAVQTEGRTLPVTFKLGTDTEPTYHTFTTLEELADFYTKAMIHIQQTLAEGWKKKDAFDQDKYGT